MKISELLHNLMMAFTGAGAFAFCIGHGTGLSVTLALNTAAFFAWSIIRNREVRHGSRTVAADSGPEDGR